MKLAIISHTEHYKLDDGTLVGWSPTVNEINHLLEVFDEIYHLAMLHDKSAPPSVMQYTSNRIKFIPIPAVGGKTILSKFNIVFNAPKSLRIITKTLKKVDVFQLRTPTGIGVYLIPYLSFFVKHKGWFKYAGNWNQQRPPFGYALQRYFLKNQKRVVTINGSWKNQQQHLLTFENPCLTKEDITLGEQIVKEKYLDGKVKFCFVGRLEKEKGVEFIIKAFSRLPDSFKAKVDCVTLVGDGKEIEYFKTIANESGVDFIFKGFLGRKEVFKIYKASHIFLLPSMASEGFPKVIAEAVNFGCIPIVSNVSSIGQYIDDDKGFIINSLTIDNLVVRLKKVINLSDSDYRKLSQSNSTFVYKFSFENYNHRIVNEIIN